MNDSDILDHIQGLRMVLSEAVEDLTGADHELLMTACSLFIAGLDALLVLREHD